MTVPTVAKYWVRASSGRQSLYRKNDWMDLIGAALDVSAKAFGIFQRMCKHYRSYSYQHEHVLPQVLDKPTTTSKL